MGTRDVSARANDPRSELSRSQVDLISDDTDIMKRPEVKVNEV